MSIQRFLRDLDAQREKGRNLAFGNGDDAVIWQLYADSKEISLTMGDLRAALADMERLERHLLQTHHCVEGMCR